MLAGSIRVNFKRIREDTLDISLLLHTVFKFGGVLPRHPELKVDQMSET
jgi:hypothetical protein